jgi:hypothetical protein
VRGEILVFRLQRFFKIKSFRRLKNATHSFKCRAVAKLLGEFNHSRFHSGVCARLQYGNTFSTQNDEEFITKSLG